PELLSVLDFTPARPEILRPAGTVEQVYRTPAREFRLSRIQVEEGEPVRLAAPVGPQILLCTSGNVVLSTSGDAGETEAGGSPPRVELAQGRSAFVRADEGAVTLTGAATVFRATANLD